MIIFFKFHKMEQNARSKRLRALLTTLIFKSVMVAFIYFELIKTPHLKIVGYLSNVCLREQNMRANLLNARTLFRFFFNL